LIDAKKRSLGFIDGTSSKNRILTRAADATMAWGDCITGEVEDTETHYFMPREGAAMILDGFAILAKSQHRELAENFINYLLDAKIAAQTAEFLNGPTPNKAALPFINPVKLKNPSIYPPPDQMSRLEMVKDVGEFSKIYDEIWTQIKAQ
jgi:spermidine/putrescine transport system substrate-binding protein